MSARSKVIVEIAKVLLQAALSAAIAYGLVQWEHTRWLREQEAQRTTWLEQQQVLAGQRFKEIDSQAAADYLTWVKQQESLRKKEAEELARAQDEWFRQQTHLLEQKLAEIGADHAVGNAYWREQQRLLRQQQVFERKVALLDSLLKEFDDCASWLDRRWRSRCAFEAQWTLMTSEKSLSDKGYEELARTVSQIQEAALQFDQAQGRLYRCLYALAIWYQSPAVAESSKQFGDSFQKTVSACEADEDMREWSKVVKQEILKKGKRVETLDSLRARLPYAGTKYAESWAATAQQFLALSEAINKEIFGTPQGP